VKRAEENRSIKAKRVRNWREESAAIGAEAARTLSGQFGEGTVNWSRKLALRLQDSDFEFSKVDDEKEDL